MPAKTSPKAARSRLLAQVRAGHLGIADAIDACAASRALGDVKIVGLLRSHPAYAHLRDDKAGEDLIAETLWLCDLDRLTLVSSLTTDDRDMLAAVWADPTAFTAAPPGWPFWPQ